MSNGVGGEGRVCVCESISEFPVVSWLLIMRRRAREVTLSASLNARIYVNSALSSAIPCYSFALPFLFYGFCLWLLFLALLLAFFPSCFLLFLLCHLTELPEWAACIQTVNVADSANSARQSLHSPYTLYKYPLYLSTYTPFIPYGRRMKRSK